MTAVVIKGEFDRSRGDHRAARELLADGVDTLVIEGQANEGSLG